MSNQKEPITLKVSSGGNVKSIAGAIIENLKKVKAKEIIKIRAIGAGSVNQATKAMIVARSIGVPIGVDFTHEASFADVIFQQDGESVKKSAIEWILHKKL